MTGASEKASGLTLFSYYASHYDLGRRTACFGAQGVTIFGWKMAAEFGNVGCKIDQFNKD